MIDELLRRILGGLQVPIPQATEDRLSKLEKQVKKLQQENKHLDKSLKDLRAHVDEWVGVKGYN